MLDLLIHLFIKLLFIYCSFFYIDCGAVSQNLSDDFAVSVEAWHLLNTYPDYKNGLSTVQKHCVKMLFINIRCCDIVME